MFGKKKPPSDLSQADCFSFGFALPLATPISLPLPLPLPPLATFLDTLGGPLNPTGLTNCMKRGARRTYGAGSITALATWPGWARWPWSYKLT